MKKSKGDKRLEENNKKSEEILFKRALWERKIKSTDSFNKLWNYFCSLTEETSFQKKVATLRKRYSLPVNGIPPTEIESNYVSRYFIMKGSWQMFIYEVEAISEEYGLFSNWGAHTLRYYVLFNIFDKPEMGTLSQFMLSDLTQVFKKYEEYTVKERREKDLMPVEEKIENLKHLSKRHPVAILIGPYASEREVVDYVKKMWNLGIKPILDKHKNPKIKLGKTRKRNLNKKERNEFIFKNRHLKPKEIVSLVAKNYGVLDYVYIKKIIRDEAKKISVHR